MLEYWKDGKKVECKAIYGNGYLNQVVVFDHVSFGDKPDLEKYPLAQYPQPHTFTIIEKVEGADGHYVLADTKGNHVVLRDEYFGPSAGYLYDMNEWLAWNMGHTAEKLSRKEHKIEILEAHLALLKDILTEQGVRILTKERVEALGIAIR